MAAGKARMSFDKSEFVDFATALRVDTKERGLVSLGLNFSAPQWHMLNEIQAGFEQGQHEFVVLKSRQLGVSTVWLALDLYWVCANVVRGALVTHEEKARDDFRTTLELYRASLPEQWQREVIDDNRNHLVFAHGSRLAYLVAGTKQRSSGSSKLGRSGALGQMHATEVAFWGDFSGVDSLRATFAQSHPGRLYAWESTANGFNGFHDLWQEAEGSSTTRQVFLSWWLSEFYELNPASREFASYWSASPRLTREEDAIGKQVAKDYRVQIDERKWAWYRWMAAERITNDAQMSQEYPHLPHEAFVSSGRAFFRDSTLTRAYRATRMKPKTYRIQTARDFSDTRVLPARHGATLAVWFEPISAAYYVIGMDPSYASNPDSDRTAVSVWRAWYNRLEQVAEFCDAEVPTHASAWILAYLGGWYGQSCVNIEIDGPGQTVLIELRHLQRSASSRFEADQASAMRNVVRHIRHYIYRRPDTLGSVSNSIHTKMTAEIKERALNQLRDLLERELAVPHSAELLEECRLMERRGGSAPAASSGHDDRVLAAALAVMCWSDQMRTQLLARGVIWREGEGSSDPETATAANPTEYLIQNYLRRIGIVPQDAPTPKRTTARGRPSWRGEQMAREVRKG